MTDYELPSELGISPEDWDKTPHSVQELILSLYPLVQGNSKLAAAFEGPHMRDRRSEKDMLRAIDEGFGLFADAEDPQDWFEELRRERSRDDERDADWP